jgi:hypothetical protein
MIEGTIKEIAAKYLFNGVELDDQEWYTILRVLERGGVAQVIGQKKHVGAGRQSKIFQIPNESLIRFSPK